MLFIERAIFAATIINNNFVLALCCTECQFYCQEKGQIFELEVKMNLQFQWHFEEISDI